MSRALGWTLSGLILMAAGALVWWWDFSLFMQRPLAAGQAPFQYTVASGYSIRRIAADLNRAGVLRKPAYWELYARAIGAARQVHIGEYTIDPSLTPPQLLRRFTTGRVIQYSFTLIEGWTFRQLRAALHADPVLVRTLHEATDDEIMEAIGAPGVHPEGRFLPDTYLFPRGTTDRDFLRRAYHSMRVELERQWRDRDPDLVLESAEQALILASIVERETAVAAERTTIAGVFSERLRRRMYLQTDPTVIYGMGEAYQGRIRYRDLRRDTPYNTYTRKGLPPTPIAMPSRESIVAVCHPRYTGALYFVARGDGTHQFSKSLEEHNQAVIKYQLGGDASRLRRN